MPTPEDLREWLYSRLATAETDHDRAVPNALLRLVEARSPKPEAAANDERYAQEK